MGNVHMEATQINYRGGSKKMSVEEAIKAAGTEITPEEKTWIDSIPALTTSNAGKTDQGVIAPEFDSEAGVYAIGDLVMHEGKLYEFTSAHETAGDWDSSEVTEKTVADEVNTVKSGLTNLNGKFAVVTLTLADTLDGISSVSMPAGWSAENTMIIGYNAYFAPTSVWFTNNDGVYLDANRNIVSTSVKNVGFASQTCNILLFKFA